MNRTALSTTFQSALIEDYISLELHKSYSYVS